ncbi:acetaldehyde dehydrogenase (acetylating) [Desulfoluna spongiiphila]|uniref:Acetaldehyde dehydrogenase n=1 Tax=Desulfoluna spongiiphila TaxID=419481 RepID=A0A1G5EAZ3_9BACT|nr:acetaldehyde dehydrogenase (acetylating) [Desulfoluna spongiiphila]SCY23921.1 acetaldehyde dehydrogenase [Desulfoluna spongiiphila]VVS91681.1 acetaldehyde dehydrogenase acetylating [Desulfoluna spongiiphila]
MVDKDLLSIQETRALVRAARAAQPTLPQAGQERVDALIEAIAKVGAEMAEELGKMASEETGYGKWQDKKQKNILASEKLVSYYRGTKTIGIINEDTERKIVEIAAPMGVIAGLIPSTNPTSTTMYKAIISLMSGNGIVFSPHPTAVKCITATVNMIRGVLKAMDFPEDLVGVISVPTMQGTDELMKITDMILATGGNAMVKAAYSSGTPALGVGSGNVPAFIERSADVDVAVQKILSSKTFDNGTVCASEQSIVTEACIADKVKASVIAQGGYFLEGEKLDKVKRIMERGNGSMNPAIVGRCAADIAKVAGIEIPAGTTLLLCDEPGVGPKFPFSKEKLTALLGFYVVNDWQEACELCYKLLMNGGLGHSIGIHSNNETVIREFALKKPVSRCLVNTPTTQGAVGITTNMAPSLTLGCGTVGGSATSENVGPQQLFNIRRMAYGLDDAAATTGSAPAENIDVQAVTNMIMEQLKKMSGTV